jgi:hypothetical protein
MKHLTILAGVLGLAATLFAQQTQQQTAAEPKKTADAPKTMVVERPILQAAKSGAPEKYDLAKTGIEWHKGIESVLNKGKPILLLQILGNYDDVYC